MTDRPTVAPYGSELTPRELEAIEAYRLCKSERAAARYLGIAQPTLKQHLANARSRRGVHRTWELFEDYAA